MDKNSEKRSYGRRFAEHRLRRRIERLSDEGRQVKKLRNTELELEILKKAIAVLQSTGCAAASGGSQGDGGSKKVQGRLRCSTEE